MSVFCREGGGAAKIRRSGGDRGGFQCLGQAIEQIADHEGDGVIVLGGETARLAVEVFRDGYGDVADFLHVGSTSRRVEFGLCIVCAFCR